MSANRDALFGGAGAKPASSAPGSGSAPRPSQPSRPAAAAAAAGGSRLPASSVRKTGPYASGTVLRGEAKVAKMKEAEVFRQKAKKAMTKGVFSSPDPMAASMHYRRAADAYRACGENRLERFHRIASADTQMGQDAYATAAAEYCRAAELAAASDEPQEKRRFETHKLYSDAAEAWRQQNEPSKAGDCLMKAALGLLIGTEGDAAEGAGGGGGLMSMEKKALQAMEEAVEAHVPDPLNRYARFRQTGTSAYSDPSLDGASQKASMALARNNLVKAPYAHEAVYRACFQLIQYGEYPSALYAAGAATTLLDFDGLATISLARAFAAETILTLALGDVVAADKYFLEVHLQRNSYLRARECKLSEDLIRAVKTMDGEALEEARAPSGENRAALANLDPGLRGLVANLRVSGRAAANAPSAPARPTAEILPPAGVAAPAPRSAPDGKALDDELDGLMDDMGLGGGGGVAVGGPGAGTEEEEDDDFDIDLR